MSMLELSHVSKSFGSQTVVNDLSFSIREHSIFGLIGQNGAGKTTTMKMILGLLPADRGEIRVNQERIRFGQAKTQARIGYLPDVPEFYGFMTPREYLMLCGRMTGMTTSQSKRKAYELLEMVGLEAANKRIHGFSRGMKQRLGIAQALMNDPPLLICDEPTSALDPVGRKEVLELLSLVKKQTTILFSSHILSDVERICDELAFLHQGKIVRSGTLEAIKSARQEEGRSLEIEFHSAADAERFRQRFPASLGSGPLRLTLEEQSESEMLNIMRSLAEAQLPVRRIERLEPTLEQLFMEMVRE